MHISSLELLRKRYGAVSIPLEVVRREHFPHLGTSQLLRAIRCGRISLRVVSEDFGGVKKRVVYLHDLAQFIDAAFSLNKIPEN